MFHQERKAETKGFCEKRLNFPPALLMLWVPKHQSGWLKWYFSRNNEISVSGERKKSILSARSPNRERRILAAAREKRKEREAFSLLWYIHTSRDRHLCPEIKKNFILDTAVCHCYRNINAISSRPIFLSRNDFKQREEIHSVEDTLSFSHTHTELPGALFFSPTAHPASEKGRGRFFIRLVFSLISTKEKWIEHNEMESAQIMPLLLPHFAAKVHCCVQKLHFAHANVGRDALWLPNQLNSSLTET